MTRLGIVTAAAGPDRTPPPAAPAPAAVPTVAPSSRTRAAAAPLTKERLRLRADLAYALAGLEGRERLGQNDLATADRLAVTLLDRWRESGRTAAR